MLTCYQCNKSFPAPDWQWIVQCPHCTHHTFNSEWKEPKTPVYEPGGRPMYTCRVKHIFRSVYLRYGYDKRKRSIFGPFFIRLEFHWAKKPH